MEHMLDRIGMHRHIERESRVGLGLELGTFRSCELFILVRFHLASSGDWNPGWLWHQAFLLLGASHIVSHLIFIKIL